MGQDRKFFSQNRLGADPAGEHTLQSNESLPKVYLQNTNLTDAHLSLHMLSGIVFSPWCRQIVPTVLTQHTLLWSRISSWGKAETQVTWQYHFTSSHLQCYKPLLKPTLHAPPYHSTLPKSTWRLFLKQVTVAKPFGDKLVRSSHTANTAS